MRITTRCQRNQVRSTLFKPGTVAMIFKELKSRSLRWRSSLALYRSSPTLQLACRNGHLIFRNKIHSGTHRQNPLLAAARESGHIPPSFSNKAINAVPSPVWPRSQQRHTSCLVPIGHDFSYAIPAVSSPLATISATPYQLSRPHRPRAQLRRTSCLVPIGHELSYAIPAVSSPLRPRAQLYHTSCLVPIGHDFSYSIPAVSSPLATSSALPYQLSRPHWPRAQLRHTSHSLSPFLYGPSLNICTPSLRFTKCAVVPRPDLTHALTPIPRRLHQARYIVLGCGSFVRGRKRKKGDSIPFILSRRDYPMRLHGECPWWASTQDGLSSIPIIYIPNPSSTWQSSNGA